MVLGERLKNREKNQWERRDQKWNTDVHLIEDKGSTSERRMKNAFFNRLLLEPLYEYPFGKSSRGCGLWLQKRKF